MVKGLMEDAVKRLASLRTQVEQRFERVDTRLDAMDAHLGSIDTRLDRVENMLAQILARLSENPSYLFSGGEVQSLSVSN